MSRPRAGGSQANKEADPSTGHQAQVNTAPAPNQHHFEETKGYLKCTKCGTNVHKRVNEQAFNDYIQGPCLDCPFDGTHTGHPSHYLWQKGHKISCTLCGLQLHLDSNRRIISSANFLKECRGAGTKGSPPIHTFFKPTPPTPADGVQAESQPEMATPLTTTGPRPKRLHFSTPLTAREDAENPAQAMTPSQNAGHTHLRRKAVRPKSEPTQRSTASTPENPEEESHTDDEVYDVDYF